MASLRWRALLTGLTLVVAATGCTADPPTGSAPARSPAPGPSSPAAPPAATRPVIGQWHRLVYHQRLGALVLVNGGPEAGKAPDDPLELWSWDGAGWHRLSDDGPVWRNFAAVAYDAHRGVLVVHGGLQPGRAPFPETWEWDGVAWRHFEGALPGGREGAGMAYDARRRRVVLFGGAVGSDVRADTWAWDGAAWRRLATAGPSPRFPGLMEYDPTRGQVVLYGGHAVDGGPTHLADTWVWSGQSWRLVARRSAPGPRVNLGAAFHSGTNRLLLIGGGGTAATLADVWSWTGAGWRRDAVTGMPPRQAAGVAYDPVRRVVVLTGGIDRPGSLQPYQDVWELAGSTAVRRG